MKKARRNRGKVYRALVATTLEVKGVVMQMVLDFVDDGQLNLFLATEPEYCRYCDVVEVGPGDVYCAGCTDAVCRDLHELYARA